MTLSAVPSFTVNVTWPLASLGPLAAEIVEEPPSGVSDTVLPATGVPEESFRVTVIVEVVASSAGTLAGLAVAVDAPESTVEPPPPETVTALGPKPAAAFPATSLIDVPAYVISTGSPVEKL